MFIIAGVAVFLALVAFFSHYYRRNWSRNLEVGIRFSNGEVFEGQSGEIHQIVTNRKMLPFWWGNIQFSLPNFIELKNKDYSARHNYKGTVCAFSYEKADRTICFQAMKRGYFRLSGAELLTQDMFFQRRFIRDYAIHSELYVYPSTRKIAKMSEQLNRITGDIIAKRHFLQDPFQFRGIRDYSPFDTIKLINWNATARTGELKVNEFSSTTSLSCLMLLDIDGFDTWTRVDVQEDAVRVCAYLAKKLLAAGVPVGFASNARDVVDGGEITAPCRNGKRQYETLLRKLSRADIGKPSRPFINLLNGCTHKSTANQQIILVSFYDRPDLVECVEAARHSGRDLKWILVADKGRKNSPASHAATEICEVL